MRKDPSSSTDQFGSDPGKLTDWGVGLSISFYWHWPPCLQMQGSSQPHPGDQVSLWSGWSRKWLLWWDWRDGERVLPWWFSECYISIRNCIGSRLHARDVWLFDPHLIISDFLTGTPVIWQEHPYRGVSNGHWDEEDSCSVCNYVWQHQSPQELLSASQKLVY